MNDKPAASLAGGEKATPLPLDPGLLARFEAARVKEESRQRLRERIRRERRVLMPMLAVVLIAWPNFGTGKVVGKSMEPTYHTGNTLILLKTYRWFSPIKVGDRVVVLMKHGKIAGEEIVKRVIFVQNATGTAPWPTYLATGRGQIPAAILFPSYVRGTDVVPPNSVMVMGDNIMNSMDSRDFGPIAMNEIVGKVLTP